MAKTRIFIADNNYLGRKGLQAFLSGNNDLILAGEAVNSAELFKNFAVSFANLLIIDFSSPFFTAENIRDFKKKFPLVPVLAITIPLSRAKIAKAMDFGVKSYLLKECDEEEITEAIYKTVKGEQFLCGKVVDILVNEESSSSEPSCKGLNVSDREIEIISLIAEGYSNKQIADKLFLSTHTVTTHRKNIMNKLDINNTAGLVLFAVRENLISPNKYLFSSAS
jgi:DNA-binding NarL/FixJ family response regulator